MLHRLRSLAEVLIDRQSQQTREARESGNECVARIGRHPEPAPDSRRDSDARTPPPFGFSRCRRSPFTACVSAAVPAAAGAWWSAIQLSVAARKVIVARWDVPDFSGFNTRNSP